MVKVDNVGVLVFHRSMPVWVAMRLRPFPAFVFMSMVLIVDMQVLVLRGPVPVLKFARVVSRPQCQRSERCSQSHNREYRESSG